MSSPAPPRRVLVVSASMGAGHHGVADELVRRLGAAGHVAERIDVLELGRPGQGGRLRDTYTFLLRWMPWVYDAAMRLWARWPAPMELLTARGAAAYEQGLLREVERFGPDVVLSVYNLSSQALGRLRAAGRLDVPVATYVTDPGFHPYWVHPGVDLHLAALPETARGLRSAGARRAIPVGPVVAPRFAGPLPGRAQARDRLGLAPEATVVLVAAGSWASGDVAATVDLLARSGTVVPVVLCGCDTGLQRRLAGRGVGLALGWTDDVASLMAAADVLVDNAGGLTCWEALTCRLPVVLFRPLAGHGRLNAEALESAGLVRYARSAAELLPLVRAARRPGAFAATPTDPVQPVLDLSLPSAAGRPA